MDRSKFDFHPAFMIKEGLVMPEGDDFFDSCRGGAETIKCWNCSSGDVSE
jgi:hypothetical protein